MTLFLPAAIIFFLVFLLFLPFDRIGGRRPQFPKPEERVDERDVMFARMARIEGTPEYVDYYSRRPELKREDDRLRAMTPLHAPGSLYYDREITLEAERFFETIEDIEPDPAVVEEWKSRLEDTVDHNAVIGEMALELGAVEVGFSPLIEEFVYTHKGRFSGDYGFQVRLAHPAAIVFLVEMEYDEMKHAPSAEVIRESARQYYRAAVIAKTIEAALKASGWNAEAHYDAHYDLILPPLAVEAGLGEIGRNNILIADRYGSRVRIGAVTTDLQVYYDAPVRLGADDFCAICRKCAENCPARALSLREKDHVRGVEKWTTDTEKCYGFWRQAGTDCGICMAVCPFSHRNSLFHNTVRKVMPLNPWMRRVALFFDDLIYGRNWKPNP